MFDWNFMKLMNGFHPVELCNIDAVGWAAGRASGL